MTCYFITKLRNRNARGTFQLETIFPNMNVIFEFDSSTHEILHQISFFFQWYRGIFFKCSFITGNRAVVVTVE